MIIRKKIFKLHDQYESVRKTIEDEEKFANLLSISKFDAENRTIEFKTEKIHPKCKNNNITPVMMLFSNPHPLSVKNGMFLSEPHSRLFWRRLFECESMNPPEDLFNAVANWTNSSPNILSNHLLNGGYSDKFMLFFDCLELVSRKFLARGYTHFTCISMKKSNFNQSIFLKRQGFQLN